MRTDRGIAATVSMKERMFAGKRVCAVEPRNRKELANWVCVVLGVDVSGSAVLDGSDSPLDYLEWAFLGGTPGDGVVWGSRGSGKTYFAAIATVLDLVFRDGIEVKVLGGSREQSQRMHAHLRKFFERPGLAEMVEGRIGERRGRLKNGSMVEVLAQSERSVRGTRPQKLRCDEVELFDEDVWHAAQLTTRSKRCGKGNRAVIVRGAVEAFSTCHRPGGLMSKLIADAQESNSRRLFRWTAIDVLERCPPSRECPPCELLDECAGRAKARRGKGHFPIDDAITMKRRSARETWESEMLCYRPTRRAAVFPEFDPALHVVASDPLPSPQDPNPSSPSLIAGMDFGFRSPTVILWASADESNVVRIIRERVEKEVLLEQHIRAILDQPPPPVHVPGAGEVAEFSRPERAFTPGLPIKWIAVDPAGNQRSDQTGLSPIAILRRAGIAVKHRPSSIEEGLRLIRARLAPASGPPTLYIHERCTHLIESLTNYRFPDNEQIATPLKDGHDHAVDALRYMLINLDTARSGEVGRY
jgi:hypothetical protein